MGKNKTFAFRFSNGYKSHQGMVFKEKFTAQICVAASFVKSILKSKFIAAIIAAIMVEFYPL